jgi:nucleoid-associated protein EbfC
MMKGLGGIGNIMKQAQQLQERMGEMQAEIERLEIEGKSGGGLVTVTLSGKGEMKGLSIDPSLVKPDEAEILEDLIVAAHADAKAKAEAVLQEKMKQFSGGLPLPPGMKFF